jgi:hypothetical protein
VLDLLDLLCVVDVPVELKEEFLQEKCAFGQMRGHSVKQVEILLIFGQKPEHDEFSFTDFTCA